MRVAYCRFVPDSHSSAGATPAQHVARLQAAQVWLVLPTYNEAGNLEPLVEAALGRLPDSRRVLIVDDNSPDGTGEIADRLAAENEDVAVLHRPRKEGLGPACQAGFREALAGGAELVIEMDADFSHDPAYLPQLLQAAEDADMVIGSRYVDGGGVGDWGPWRRMISKGGNAYARNTLGIDIRDLTGAFKCYRREVLEGVDFEAITARGYVFQVEMPYRAIREGFRVVEVPIVFHERREGKSKMTTRIIAEAIWTLLAIRIAGRRWSLRTLQNPHTVLSLSPKAVNQETRVGVKPPRGKSPPTAPFDYSTIPPGHYDRVFRRRRGIQSKWHHLKFQRVARLVAGSPPGARRRLRPGDASRHAG